MGKVNFLLIDNLFRNYRASELVHSGDYYPASDYEALEAENQRLIGIAGDALGFSAYHKKIKTVSPRRGDGGSMGIVCFVQITAAVTTAIAFAIWQDSFMAGLFMFLACSLYQYNSDLNRR